MSTLEKMERVTYNVTELPCTRKHGRFFDVNIICKDTVYGAHKFILAMQSNYLKELFLTITQEAQNSQDTCKIVMDDLKEIDVENILNYIYDGEIGVTKSNVGRFLQAGKYLRLDTITDLMEENEEFNLKSDKFQKKFGTTNLSHNVKLMTPLKAGSKESVESPIQKRTFKSTIVNNDSPCDKKSAPLNSTMINRTEFPLRKNHSHGDSTDSASNDNSGTFQDETAAFSAISHDSRYHKTPSTSSVWTFGDTMDNVFDQAITS